MLPILRPCTCKPARNKQNVDAVAGRVVDVCQASAEVIRKSRTILQAHLGLTVSLFVAAVASEKHASRVPAPGSCFTV